MKPFLRRGLYLVLASAWVSGLLFYVLRRWCQVEGEFGLESHPWQTTVLMCHGAMAMLMVAGIGAILASHVPLAWRTKRSRWHGITLLVSVTSMALSGWALYYLSSESVRAWVGLLHLVIGLCLPALLLGHIVFGRSSGANVNRARLGWSPAAPHTVSTGPESEQA